MRQKSASLLLSKMHDDFAIKKIIRDNEYKDKFGSYNSRLSPLAS